MLNDTYNITNDNQFYIKEQYTASCRCTIAVVLVGVLFGSLLQPFI